MAAYKGSSPFSEDEKPDTASYPPNWMSRAPAGTLAADGLDGRDMSRGRPDGPGSRPQSCFVRGDFRHEATRSSRDSRARSWATPAAVLETDRYLQFPTRGWRMTLAKWIARPDNPLTARVMVNRIWQYHFGRGIVGTPSNFGKNGERPTHPELLDWLAMPSSSGAGASRRFTV